MKHLATCLAPRLVALSLLAVFATLASATNPVLTGTVKSGGTPIAGANVTLYDAGHDRGALPTILGCAVTDNSGAFHIAYTVANGEVLYITSKGPAPAVDLAVVVGLSGTPATPTSIVVNEITTLASAFAMAQFMNGDNVGGKSPGLPIAAATVANMANVRTGAIGTVLATEPNGSNTTTLAEFNSLANLIAACVEGTPIVCGQLFADATPPGGTTPTNTLQAALSIAHNPWNNVAALFTLSQSNSDYSPVLPSAPDAWTIALLYLGNGKEMIGPGNMAIDADGYIWVVNNYEPIVDTCGGKLLSKLTPEGADFPGAPYSGGGVNGAGFGVTLDPAGLVWVGNFGFKGTNCSSNDLPPANSVSTFTRSGIPLSPAISGWTGNGFIHSPQGVVSDQQGNIWIANYGTRANPIHYVTELVRGNPRVVKTFINNSNDLTAAFDVAFDAQGNAWITSNGTNAVIKLNPATSTYEVFKVPGLVRPLGLATDSLGNVWIAASAGKDPTTVGAIVALHNDGTPLPGSPYVSGGIRGPWGLAIDGNDNVWVSNFIGEHLSELCGARPQNCPQGKQTGDAISPSTGYTSNAMVRLTSTVVDQSGNVWVPNNWKTVPIQTNPGGNGLVEFVGVAAPVKTPMIGPPQQP